MRGHTKKVVLGTIVLALAATVWAAVGSAAPQKANRIHAGGTYRVGWEQSFGFTDNFDPTGEYLGNAWALYSNLLIRTLVGYNHVAGAAGNKLVPDIARSIPHPTNGGKVYTFKLKNGIKFGPPVNRVVTSHDVLYAMQRLAKPSYGAQYAFYYDDSSLGAIKGWHAYATGKAKSIAGIKTPDKSTIVFTLTKPEGDFLYRMAMPATGPIPGEIAKCFQGSKANNYGRDLVSTGPYMIEGSDAVGKTCATIKPMSGYDGANGTHLILVRNPSYNAATDSKSARENLPDRFEFTINSNSDDIFNKVQAGELDDEVSSPSPKVLRQYSTNPSLKPHMHINVGDRTWYITLNLTQPPFDDIHVRKAMNYVMDKASLQKAWGGPTAGSVATHIVPDPMLQNVLKSFDPYGSPNHSGNAAKAAAEMKQSKYSGGSGKCTASACKNVLMIADTRAVDTRMIPVIQSSAAKIGITFKVRTVNGAYPVIQTPSKNVPISERPGWGKDYADPSTFFNALFDSSSILASGNTNYSLVGITPSIAKKVGAKGTLTGVPSVDSDIAKCNASAGEFRNACWAQLDRKLMNQVVPWVPYLSASNINITGPNVTKWSYDQFSDQTAYAHVAVK